MRRWFALIVLTLLAPASLGQLYQRGAVPSERVAPVSYTDLGGLRARLDQPRGKAGAVVIIRDTECPVSQRYEPRVAELARRFGNRGFDFVIVDATPHDRKEAMAAARKLPGTRTILEDSKLLIQALRARSTAEAFVIDAGATLQYRGAIDDQYGLDHQKGKVTHAWLVDALEASLRGESAPVQATEARGCPLSIDLKSTGASAELTYHSRVSRIVQSRCQVCHRKDGLGPMPLETYRQVYERRAVIDLMVSSGRMPPWFANRAVGHWANDRSLTDSERQDLLAWIKAGAPEGDAKMAPSPKRFVSGWNIGKPDHVITIPKPFKVPAQGEVDYQNFYIKTDLPADRWVTAMEIKPTQAKVVHHALAFLEEPGRRALTPEELAKLKPGDPRPPPPNDAVSGFFAATAPGSQGISFPPGMGKRLPKGAWIRIEMHYQPNGRELVDRTQIGFRFSGKPLREVESLSAFNTGFKIPPNARRHEVKAEYRFERPGTLLSLFPHMHFRGAGFRYDLRYPDGKQVPLLDVPKFDFGWQSYYQFATPLHVPAGARLLATAWFDNSRENRWNPDPTKTVTWGLQTTDEMMIGYFDFSSD